MFIVTHTPSEHLPKVPVGDKIEHLFAYMLLAGLLFFCLRTGRKKTSDVPVSVLAITMIYGAFDEWMQAIPFIRRDCSFADWTADVTGAAIAVVVLTMLVRVYRTG